MSLKFLLKLCLLCNAALCFQFRKECVTAHRFETDRIATSWDVSVWAPREDTDARILTLVSKNDTSSSLRKIDITRTELHTLFMNNGIKEKKPTSIPGDGISPGWVKFRVTSDSRFKVWVTGVDEPLVDVEDDVRAERVVVKGSNVTINCREPMVIWNVTKHRVAALPLAGPGRYDLAVFSRSSSSPVVTLGDQTRVLSWDPEANMVTTFATEPRALPAFIQHNFTVECSQAENHFRYDVLAGQNETLVGSVSLPYEIDALSIHGSDDENFIVILRYIRVMMRIPEEHEEAVAGNCFNGTVFLYFLLFIPLLAVVVAVICVTKKLMNLCKNGKHKRSVTFSAIQPPEDKPLNGNDANRRRCC